MTGLEAILHGMQNGIDLVYDYDAGCTRLGELEVDPEMVEHLEESGHIKRGEVVGEPCGGVGAYLPFELV